MCICCPDVQYLGRGAEVSYVGTQGSPGRKVGRSPWETEMGVSRRRQSLDRRVLLLPTRTAVARLRCLGFRWIRLHLGFRQDLDIE